MNCKHENAELLGVSTTGLFFYAELECPECGAKGPVKISYETYQKFLSLEGIKDKGMTGFD